MQSSMLLRCTKKEGTKARHTHLQVRRLRTVGIAKLSRCLEHRHDNDRENHLTNEKGQRLLLAVHLSRSLQVHREAHVSSCCWQACSVPAHHEVVDLGDIDLSLDLQHTASIQACAAPDPTAALEL